MKKKVVVALLVVTMVSTMLSGCKKIVGAALQAAIDEMNSQTTEEISEEVTSQEETSQEDMGSQKDQNDNAKAHEAYMAFLNGEGTIVTHEDYNNYDGYPGSFSYGTYTYASLKSTYESFEGYPTATKIAFVDFGNDGTEEMVLRLENTQPSYMNWNGIFHYQDGEITLMYDFEDGYRTYSEIYESGYFELGGSWGAGAYGADYFSLDEKGYPTCLYSCNQFWSSFATQIAYDLTTDGTSGTVDWDTLGYVLDDRSELEISEYVPAARNGKGVKICVDARSTSDKEVMDAEERFINELVKMGAELVSREEFNKLLTADTSAPTLNYSDWEDKVTLLNIKNMEWMYPTPEDYYYTVCNDDEYSMTAYITTNKTIKNVQVLSIFCNDYVDDKMVFSYNVMDGYDAITPDKGLAIKFTFMGDFPNYGISFVDENGNTKFYAISQGGYDGGLVLEEALLK